MLTMKESVLIGFSTVNKDRHVKGAMAHKESDLWQYFIIELEKHEHNQALLENVFGLGKNYFNGV